MNSRTVCAALSVLLVALTANSEMVFIDSVTTNGDDVVTSVTDAYGTYTNLLEATTLSNLTAQADWDFIALQPAPAPANMSEACDGFIITKGCLNQSFWFDYNYALSDTTRFFIMANRADGINDNPTIRATKPGGNTIGYDKTINFTGLGTGDPVLHAGGVWNRTGGLLLSPRRVYGATFTLEDIGLGGYGATGFKVTGVNNFDLQMIGIMPQPPSGIITGSVELLSGTLNVYNLTDLGNLDWAYWYADNTVTNISGIASNEMANAELIGVAEAVGTGSVRGSTSNTRPNVGFTATNGSHPVVDDVTNPRPSGIFSEHLDNTAKGVSVPITLPKAGLEYTVTIFGGAYNAKAVLTAGFPGELASYVDYTLSGGNTVKSVGVYTLYATPAKDNETLDVRIRMYETNPGGNAHVLLVGAAVSATLPPAATIILLQ